MSVAGTLYEETVKFGHAKLLSTQTASSVVYLTFISQFTSEFNSYHFDFINLTHGDPSWPIFCCQFTNDGGASWITGYWWASYYNCSHGPAYGTQGSVYNANLTNVVRLSLSPYHANTPLAGEAQMYCSPGKSMSWQSHISVNEPNNGQGQWIVGAALDAGANGIRFFYYNGTPILSGTIRMYGLRSGLV
jgi:hypothetical protein